MNIDSSISKIKEYKRLIRVWWPLRHKSMFGKSNIRFFIKQIRNLNTNQLPEWDINAYMADPGEVKT